MKFKKVLLTAFVSLITAPAFAATVINHKSPYCGCCTEWSKYMEKKGYSVEDKLHEDMTSVKKKLGINDPRLYSCHTAQINGYVFEGHVPAEDIKAFLANPPKDAIGLTVPGMPMGSPGMDYGDKKDSYTTYVMNKNNNVTAFRFHKGNAK